MTTIDQAYLSPTAKIYGAYPSAARTATPNPQDVVVTDGSNRRAAVFVLDVTAFAVGASIVFKIEGVDRTSGKTWPVLTGAAVVTTGTSVYKVGLEYATVATVSATDIIPPVFRLTVTHGTPDSITYSLGVNLG